MAELADAPDLGSGVPDVKVQVLSGAPYRVFLQNSKRFCTTLGFFVKKTKQPRIFIPGADVKFYYVNLHAKYVFSDSFYNFP